ncbi:hypothetical protein GZZ44_10460 [Klebsiella aerogenes]|uniref:portal protein n=2 Tax=Klebsiella TaxID=570 RepID=UPI00190E9BC4|nr:hypothetical protein [Klebsiella aerogenes]MBK0633369.1 hypothetical protein [Klebsiella aerogenes]
MSEQAELFNEIERQYAAAKERQDELSERYNHAWGFYRGELPEIKQPGDLPARKVMWVAFESIYPSLVGLFTDAQKSPVIFDSDTPQNSKLSLAVTKAIHTTALKVDGFYRTIMEAVKELLITGNQVGLVGYDSRTYESDKYSFKDAPVQELAQQANILMMTGYNIDHDLEFNDDEKTVTGWIQGKREVKYPIIRLVSFKDFYLHPKATDIQNALYCAYSEEITVAKGIERGYSEAVLIKGQRIDTNAGRGLDTAMMVAGNMNAEGEMTGTVSSVSEYNDLITVYHHYWRGCYNSKTEKLHHIIATSREIISVEVVEYCPLVLGGMSIIPGSAWSESLYDYCKASQISTTRARRAIQRTADNAAYPELEVQDDMLKPDTKANLNKRGPGMIYRVKAPNAVQKLPVQDVSNAMKVLNDELNTDAEAVVQGSAGQAQALEENGQASGVAVALTQDKQELNESQIAKCIAETFLKPIYRILLLVCQEMGNTVPLDGVDIPFKAIRADLGLTIDVETPYDRANAAANVKQAYETAAQLGTLPANIQGDNAYNIYADYFRAATGQEDVSRYITPPDQMPQPSPLEQKIHAVIAACQLRATIAQTQLAEAKVHDMTADTQVKFNSAAKTLAELQKVLADIDISKGELDIDRMRLALDAEKQQSDEADQLTKNAIEQEKVDNDAASNAANVVTFPPTNGG